MIFIGDGMEQYLTDKDGNVFVIYNNNGNYDIYKLQGNEKIAATEAEIKFCLQEIEKNNNTARHQELLNILTSLVKSGKINSYSTLKSYLDNSNLSVKEKEEILENGIEKLGIEEIVTLKNRIINDLRSNKKDNLQGKISFNVCDNSFGSKYCEIKLSYQDEFSNYEHIKEQMNYNDTLERELIEPVMLEVVLQSKITSSTISKGLDPINDTGNLKIMTENKMQVNINNIDYDYAYELQKRSEKLKTEEPIANEVTRDTTINNLQNEEHANLTPDENGLVYNEQGEAIKVINSEGKLVDVTKEDLIKIKGQSRVLNKQEKGFTLTIVILALSYLLISIMVLLQIILL